MRVGVGGPGAEDEEGVNGFEEVLDKVPEDVVFKGGGETRAEDPAIRILRRARWGHRRWCCVAFCDIVSVG